MLSQKNLQQRGYSLASKCAFCGVAEVDGEHIFTECVFPKRLWDTLFGLKVPVNSLASLFSERLRTWSKQCAIEQGSLMWKLVPQAIVGILWNERNSRIF